MLAKQLQASASLKRQNEVEQDAQAEVEAAWSPMEAIPSQMSEISGNKLKTKHHKQKEKRKKQRQRESDDDLSERSDGRRMLNLGKEYPDEKDIGLARI